MHRIRNTLICAVLMLAAQAATAGLQLLPIVQFSYDPAGPLSVRSTATGTVALTASLRARLTKACGARGPAGSFIALSQQLELEFNPASGDVHGRSRALLRLPAGGETFVQQAFVSGKAICLPTGAQACGQLTLAVKVAGALAGQADGRVLGGFEIQQLGTLAQNGDASQWLAIAAGGQIGGAPELLRKVLESMEEEECGF